MNEREALIAHLIELGYLTTPRIIEAFRAIDRADFVPEELRHLAYANEPLPIGFGQTVSQPLTVAFMLELLEPQPGETVLDVGSGSGWKAALLAYVVSQPRTLADNTRTNADGNSQIVTIERIPELSTMAEQNIEKYGYVSRGIVTVLLGDGSRGAPSELVHAGGFNRIIAGAAAAEEIPQAWRDQLATSGVIVAPVDSRVVRIEKIAPGSFREQSYEGFRFVPLVRDSR